MMAKKVTIKPKPTKPAPSSLTRDEWVARGRASEPDLMPEPPQEEKIKTMRYTIDIPTTLHAQIKSKCAAKRGEDE